MNKNTKYNGWYYTIKWVIQKIFGKLHRVFRHFVIIEETSIGIWTNIVGIHRYGYTDRGE